MTRPTRTWLIFAVCLAVILAAMGWISLMTLRLDRAEADASLEGSVEGKVRLALWRMESALAPIIARESARPYFSYSAFYPAERAYTRMYAEIESGEVLMPSPLLTEMSPYILLHFQFDSDGKLTSPQVPDGNKRDLAETGYTTHERIEDSAARFAELRAVLNRDDLVGALSSEELSPLVPPPSLLRSADSGMRNHKSEIRNPQSAMPPLAQADVTQANRDVQYVFNAQEWNARASSQVALRVNAAGNVLPRFSGVSEAMMKPLWVGSALVLARRVSVNGREYVQGCRLNWPTIREWLVAGVKDLLPAADLAPARSESGDKQARMLAALPVRLVTGLVPATPPPPLTPIRLSLLIAWSVVLLAAIAVAVLLLGAVSLSERRGAFVSAVTHELRTPLTTLRMYTEMLAEGMVSEKDKIRRYLNTLRVEADRLGHLVENVLAYARLEGRPAGGRVETITLRALLDRIKNRLAQRAEQAGMNLVLQSEDEIDSASTRADTSAVEHILFNLVDNACKYAASASDRRIELEGGRGGSFVFLRVRDHGRGITKSEARRLFRPFCKSARDAANCAPGIGLGLALSRRLARDMGGDLRLDPSTTDGASFTLELPLDGI